MVFFLFCVSSLLQLYCLGFLSALTDREQAILPLYFTPIIFWFPFMGDTEAGMCGIWRIAQLLGGSSELKNYSMGV